MFQDGRGDPDPLPSYRTIAGPSFGKTLLLRAATSYSCLVSGSFNPPSRVLFNVLSRYYCTIGLRTYLGLGDSVSRLCTGFPTHATLGHHCDQGHCTYGAFTLYGHDFPDDFGFCSWTTTWAHNTTSPHGHPRGFGLPSSAFDRL